MGVLLAAGCRRNVKSAMESKGKFTMKLYFGNAVTTATTLMILALLGYIGFSVWNRGNIACWGRRTLLLLVFGLVVCCFAAARDGLDKTIQHTIDGSCAPGVFPLVSVPTVVGCAGALLIVRRPRSPHRSPERRKCGSSGSM